VSVALKATVPVTVGAGLAAAIARLRTAGVPEPEADAQVLLAYALGTTRAGVIAASRDALRPAVAARFEAALERRGMREPVAYIVGEREFWSSPLAVDRRVLIPRPETELLVELACRLAPGARAVLDCATGSAALAVALARELPAARVWASDRSRDALAVARRNVARHAPAVRLVAADLLAAFRDGAFDLVVANPPYCAECEIEGLCPEVRDFEPRQALAGGADGLDVLRALVPEATRVLAPGGWVLLEVGAGQSGSVRGFLEADGRYTDIVVADDPAGIPRALGARRRRDGTWTAS
jgi:release factor glutamine methyltransferase